MMHKRLITVIAGVMALAVSVVSAVSAAAQPQGRTLWNEGWTFTRTDGASAEETALANPSGAVALETRTGEPAASGQGATGIAAPRLLTLPHDWGVEQDFLQENPGESGKLTWWGKATYAKELILTADDLKKDIRLEVDGAFSNAKVYINQQEAGGWPYGYSSWAVDLTPFVKEGSNTVEIKLDNLPESSRWYPGGGIYRNVWITKTEKTSVAHWGTYITTKLKDNKATVFQNVTLKTDHPQIVLVDTRILIVDPVKDGIKVEHVVAQTRSVAQIYDGRVVEQDFDITDPKLWSPETPNMYLARTVITAQDGTEDVYETPFGIREAEFKADGFYLNGQKTFMKGVCLHHDAGALGAVWNDDAWVRRLQKLKEMGCNAIRCSHNPPAPELLDLCDRMGFLVIDELTDTWTVAKKPNGYATLFDQWVEKDLVAMIQRDRNHPSIILWSIGNECGEQGDPDKWWIPQMLTGICHKEDPTRPTTAGNDNPWAYTQPYALTLDVYGFNYKPHLYAEFLKKYPGRPVYGSETSSCISTRGYYRFPVEEDKSKGWDFDAPFQVSSYDLYAPAWASSPDYEWQFEDQVPECAGEFVWTGYDYIGEPTPFNMDPSVFTNFHTEEEREAYRKEVAQWGAVIADVPLPSRSSYFGIMDLAGFPKDRFWLYQSRWNPEVRMAHILPHWTWPGREGKVTPVHVYSSADEAELFVNGVSQGRKAKDGYRFRWDDVVYAPGTVEVVTYKNGAEWARDKVRTAGKAAKLSAAVDYQGEDLSFVTVDVLDKAGTLVPGADNLVTFSVKGPGEIVATDAGDPTSHLSFCSHSLPAFYGKASVIVRRTGPGAIAVTAKAKGLKSGSVKLQ